VIVVSVRRSARRFRRGLPRGWHFCDMTRACSTRSSGRAAWISVPRVLDRYWLANCLPYTKPSLTPAHDGRAL